MTPVLTRLVLGACGALLLCIGAAVLFRPEAFAAANGLALASDPSSLSEYRAPGGMLVASAVLVLLGAFRGQYTRTAFALAALVYGSYGVARLVGMGADGMPSAALTQATVVELLLGSMCLFAWLRLDRDQHEKGQR